MSPVLLPASHRMSGLPNSFKPRVGCHRSLHFTAHPMPQFPTRISTRNAPRRVTRMGLFGLGAPELAVIAGVVLLIYGPSKLPQVGRELGKTAKSFQTAAKEFEKELKEASAAEDAETPSEKKQE